MSSESKRKEREVEKRKLSAIAEREKKELLGKKQRQQRLIRERENTAKYTVTKKGGRDVVQDCEWRNGSESLAMSFSLAISRIFLIERDRL